MDEAADEQAAWLEKIRRSGISLDREGRFIHEGAEVTHEGMKRALFRWLDRLPPPDGRYVLRLDERRFAYLETWRTRRSSRAPPASTRPAPSSWRSPTAARRRWTRRR